MRAIHEPLRFLVVEGNIRDDRERHRADFGMTPSQSYGASLRAIAPAATCDIVCPADEGAALPDGAGIAGYDGVFLTGSALHVYDATAPILRQVDFAREVYRAGVPFFGSCWGIQIGAVAAGGAVSANPKGREIGFARRITRTGAGAGHALLAGRPAAWDAPAIHLDVVATLPPEADVLATNGLSEVQAAEFRFAGGRFWGVQYHPEFSLAEVAAILRRMRASLVAEGFCRDEAEVEAYCVMLAEVDSSPDRTDLAWRLGLDADVTVPMRRMLELANFITARVLPARSERARG
jgi:GMP synthase (glutamine-hydrolysing)